MSSDDRCFQEMDYFVKALAAAELVWSRLQAGCRAAKVEIMYTVIQSLTKDGRDRSNDYKISGFHVPPGSWDAKVGSAKSPRNDSRSIM